MTPATIAVITCLHQPGERLDGFLGRLDRLHEQVDDVIIVLDGVAESEHLRVLAWAAGRDAVRIVLAPEPHGVARARNLALVHCRADYVWFIDDDDEWSDHAVATIRRAATAMPDAVFFRAEYRYDDASPPRAADGVADRADIDRSVAVSHLLTGRVHGFLWSKVVRRSLWGVDPFPTLSSQSDVVGVARVIARVGSVRMIPDVLYTYVHRPGSITRSSAQRLANLREAHDLVRHDIAPVADERDLELFTAWFFCEAVVRTAVRQRVPRAEADAALVAARHRSAELSARRVARRRPGTAAVLVLLRVSPGLALLTARLAYAALDGGRALRRRLVGARGAR